MAAADCAGDRAISSDAGRPGSIRRPGSPEGKKGRRRPPAGPVPTSSATGPAISPRSAARRRTSSRSPLPPTRAETKYPDLDCVGKLTRVGSSKSYVFFVEIITKGQADKGGRCPDGTITVARAGRRARGRVVRQHPGHHRRGLRNAGEEITARRSDPILRASAARGRPPASRRSGRRGARAQARRGPRIPCSSPRRHAPPSTLLDAERAAAAARARSAPSR